jgi:Kef-type K+ transport system membrane component KefB
MKPRSQLCFANLLMTVGVLPWLLMVAWLIAFFLLTPRGGPPGIPIIDPIGMIGLTMTAFVFSLCVAGLGAFWSWRLVRAYAEMRSRTMAVIRAVVLLLLVAPLLVVVFS